MTTTHASLPDAHHGRATYETATLEGSAVAPTEPTPAMPPAIVATLRIDRRIWLGGGAIVGIGALLVAGVPASTLLLLGAVGACLGMHLFMGHGGHGGHAGHDDPAPASGDGSAPRTSGRCH